MKHWKLAALGTTLMVQAHMAHAQETVKTPEGAVMQVNSELSYKDGALTKEQLESSTRSLFVQDSANVFRRYPKGETEAMVRFYTGALALRSLNPIQLTATQQMILTGVGSGQIKLSGGQQGDRKYDLSGGPTGGTGIRFFTLTYPDAATVSSRFKEAGFAAPKFKEQPDGTKVAMVTDPGGFPIEVVIRTGARDGSNDGVGVNIGVSDLTRSREFYREFVGLDELPPVQDSVAGVTKYPYRHKETVLYLFVPKGKGADNGSAGIQYVVKDAPMVEAKAKRRGITVETPLNKLANFDLTTIWLNDPDGVTNYYAQVGPKTPAIK